MAYQKLQPTRGIGVVPNDTYNIFSPSSSVVSSGVSTSATTDSLTDANADFISAGVQVGDVVYRERYNYSSGKNRNALGTVTAVDANGTQLTVSAVADNDVSGTPTSFSMPSGIKYRIFRPSENVNNGCILYIGSIGAGGLLRVVTAAGDDLMLTGVVQGSYTPVQVVKVLEDGTNCSNITALW